MKRRAFTLIELLAVIAILGILFTLGSKTIRSTRLRAKKAQAMVEIKSVETAVKAYANKYGRLPLPAAASVAQGEGDLTFSLSDSSARHAPSAAVISILTAADNMEEADNPARMVFLEPQGSAADGTFLDPWGCQYRIALDTDYDGRITLGGREIRRTVAIAAVGLYALGNHSDTNDLIRSWQ